MGSKKLNADRSPDRRQILVGRKIARGYAETVQDGTATTSVSYKALGNGFVPKQTKQPLFVTS